MFSPLMAIGVAALLVLSGAAHAQTTPPPSPPVQAAPAQPEQPDAFGEETTLAEKTILYMNGQANWDSAFETLIDAFKQVYTYLDRQGLKPSGPSMTIYTSTDDTGFTFQAAVPLAAAPPNPPQGDLAVGKSPSGKALKYVHRGSTDPVSTPEDQLVINVIVPIK